MRLQETQPCAVSTACAAGQSLALRVVFCVRCARPPRKFLSEKQWQGRVPERGFVQVMRGNDAPRKGLRAAQNRSVQNSHPLSPPPPFFSLTNCIIDTEGSAVATLLGTGHEAGPDEDDFHTIRRKNAEMDRDEQGGERARKEAKVRAGALTGVVKAFGKVASVQPKNVVYF